jgi:adenylate cyclase
MHQQIKKLTGQNLASGINSGSVVAGVMGSEKVRLAYTVVGDPVNLAARLAAIAEKDKDDSIIISAVAANNSRLDLSLKKLDIDTVKGKTQSVKIFRLELMA